MYFVSVRIAQISTKVAVPVLGTLARCPLIGSAVGNTCFIRGNHFLCAGCLKSDHCTVTRHSGLTVERFVYVKTRQCALRRYPTCSCRPAVGRYGSAEQIKAHEHGVVKHARTRQIARTDRHMAKHRGGKPSFPTDKPETAHKAPQLRHARAQSPPHPAVRPVHQQ
jgi:hypothetical protein